MKRSSNIGVLIISETGFLFICVVHNAFSLSLLFCYLVTSPTQCMPMQPHSHPSTMLRVLVAFNTASGTIRSKTGLSSPSHSAIQCVWRVEVQNCSHLIKIIFIYGLQSLCVDFVFSMCFSVLEDHYM